MKLDSFLIKESFDSIENMDQVFMAIPDSKERIVAILESVKKKFKFVGSDFDVPINLLRLNFSNGVVQIMVGFRFGKTEGTVTAAVIKSSIVKELLLADVSKLRNPDEMIKATVWQFEKEADLKDFERECEAVLAAADKFCDWYFDMSTEYGKVKLFKSNKNLFDKNTNDQPTTFVALAGDFSYYEDTISNSVANGKIETNVY